MFDPHLLSNESSCHQDWKILLESKETGNQSKATRDKGFMRRLAVCELKCVLLIDAISDSEFWCPCIGHMIRDNRRRLVGANKSPSLHCYSIWCWVMLGTYWAYDSLQEIKSLSPGARQLQRLRPIMWWELNLFWTEVNVIIPSYLISISFLEQI